MGRLKVLKKIRSDYITASDATFIKLHVDAGYPVKVSYTNYDDTVFDSRILALSDLVDIDLVIGQSLQIAEVREKGFKGISRNGKSGFSFCYVLVDEDKWSGIVMVPPKLTEHMEDKNMGMMDGNFMQQMLGMKMLKNIFDNDAKDMNIGKLMMMQQVLGGSSIQVTDVIKAKIMEKFALDDENIDGLPLEKLLLLQMLDKGSIDIQQLIQFKMMSKMLEEDL